MGRLKAKNKQVPKALKKFYGFVKAHPCCNCGAHGPSEVAHIQGVISKKTGKFLPRSHHGPAAWSCVPLCFECHRTGRYSIHNVGEETFKYNFARSHSQSLQNVALTMLAYFNHQHLGVKGPVEVLDEEVELV